MLADAELAADAAAVPALSPVSMTVCRPRSCSSASTRAASGRGRSARRIQPTGRIAPSGPPTSRPSLLGPAEPGVELGRAQPGLVDVAMAADVILDRVDPPRAPQAGDGACSRRRSGTSRRSPRACRAIARPSTWPPRSPSAAAIRKTVVAVPAVGRDDLDHVGLASGQRPRLVERQHAEPADLLEELAALDQDPAPRRRRQAAHDRDRRRDHQGARAGDHQHDQPARRTTPAQPRPRPDASRTRAAAPSITASASGDDQRRVHRPRTARSAARSAPGPPGPRGPER